MPNFDGWRVGFEIELLLGDLFDERFEKDLDDPMDVASDDYCRAVAAKLSQATGKRWTAPKKKPARNGYYVYPEYDLDPIEWEWGIVAGVELVTPPLPIAEAEELRRHICDWVIAVDGEINTYPNDLSKTAGWHINIDGGDKVRLNPEDIALCIEEEGILFGANRYPSKYAAPQRHAYGAPLLRHLRGDFPRAQLASDMTNFLRSYAGRSKRYAANLGKLDLGYIELRHYGTERFFSETPLTELIAPFVRSTQANNETRDRAERRLFATFDVLDDWLCGIEQRLACEWLPRSEVVNISHCTTTFDSKPLGDAIWNGDTEFTLEAATGYNTPSIHEQHPDDFALSLAVLALDIAVIRHDIHDALPLKNASFSRAIDQLGAILSARGLLDETEMIMPFDKYAPHLALTKGQTDHG
jgi:hypothetical protein